MIVDRDQSIVKEWFEPYKYASISQIMKTFFRDQQFGYEIARKRLIEISKAGLIKPYHDIATNRNIYILADNKIKAPTQHRMTVLDVLAECHYCGFKVEEFSIEKPWMGGKIKSDALLIFSIRNKRYHFFIEVQLSKHDHELNRYDILFNSGEVQKYLGKNHYPRILFVSNIDYSNLHINSTEVIQLDTRLHQFPSILL